MKITANLRTLARQAGFSFTGNTVAEWQKQHAAQMLADSLWDQWTMRMADALGIGRMNLDQLKAVAQ